MTETELRNKARLWDEFQALLAKGGTVLIQHVSEHCYSGSFGVRHRDTRDLLALVMELRGEAPTKECPGCKLEKRVSFFALELRALDGRKRLCVECEVKRVAEYKKAREETAAAGAAGAAGATGAGPPPPGG